jgi:DNA replication and repair protein RecF
MFIKSLYLRHFRNYAEAEIHFSPGLNLFYGENAQGKTNLLEAISLITTGRSFRTAKLQELIQEGAPFFFLEAKVLKNDFEHTVAITFDSNGRKLILDGNSYPTLQHLLGLVPSVFFIPSDAELADGSPAVRRRFLNMHLAQRDPLYIHHLSRYWRAMKQRNALLRSVDLSAIECWEQEMVASASYLWQMRLQLLSEIQEPLKINGQFLSSDREQYEIRGHFAPQESYAAQLRKNRAREKQLGLTLTGPHRDDFNLLINGKSSSIFGSEGQKKSVAFGLRLAEWGLFTKSAEGEALLCIDDLGVHLDSMRRELFSKTLEKLGQVFVTAPDTANHFAGAKRFLITAGTTHLSC